MTTLRDRIGYDSGANRLEDSLQTAIQHGFHYLDFNADQGRNRLTNWDDARIAAVAGTASKRRLAGP